MGCMLALSKTHMAASTTRSRCNFVCYPLLTDIKLVQVQSTSRGCHPEKPSIMKGQPGNHTVLVGTNHTLPCELMVSVTKSYQNHNHKNNVTGARRCMSQRDRVLSALPGEQKKIEIKNKKRLPGQQKKTTKQNNNKTSRSTVRGPRWTRTGGTLSR